MSRYLYRPVVGLSIAALVVCSGSVLMLTGCGGNSGTQAVSAKSSQYEAADDEDGSSSPAVAPKSNNKQPTRPLNATSGTRQRITDSSSQNASGGNGSATSPSKPPAVPATALEDSYKAPSNKPEEIAAYLESLAQREPQGLTRFEQIEDFKKMQHARIAASDKLLSLEADDEFRATAVHSKLDALRLLTELGEEGSEKKMLDFAGTLRDDKNPEFARIGRLLHFGFQVGEYASSEDENKDFTPLREALTALLADGATDPNVFDVTQQAAEQLYMSGHAAEASESMRLIGNAFKDSEEESIAEGAQTLLGNARALELQAKFLELDFQTKLEQLFAGTADAEIAVSDAIKHILENEQHDEVLFEMVAQAAQYLELTGYYQTAREAYGLIAAAYEKHKDTELADAADTRIGNAIKRLELIGKPFVVEGVTLDGLKFDWSHYRGKIVLVDFWATWCGPCLQEMPNVLDNYEKFHEQGFEVVGVNLDDSREEVEQFLKKQQLPWKTVVGATPETQGFKNPMAVRCGVDAIPFIVMVDRNGIAVALHVRGAELEKKLTEMLAKDAIKAPTDPPATGNARPNPADNPTGQFQSERRSDAFSADFDADDQFQFVAFLADEDDEPAVSGDEPVNPYLARSDLSTGELIDFLLDMEFKPRSIQRRAGFTEAVVDAADRVLAADDTKPAYVRIAALAKFNVLHDKACRGDEKADEQLMAFVDEMKDSEEKQIAKQVRFLQLERKVIDADKLPLEEIPSLLDEVKAYLAEEKLDEKHLRLASSTVRAINRLDSEDPAKKDELGDQREKYFAEFGNLFTKSSNKELARYGKKLATPPAGKVSDLVGKPLELDGVTADGVAFDWNSYRGKVVLVDFWATWCGPCIREMPHVKALHEKLKDRGFDVVGVSLDKDLEALAQFIEDNQIPWQTLAGEETQAIAEKYGVRGIPTMMLVDAEGKVVSIGHNVAGLAAEAEKLISKVNEKPAEKKAA